MKTASKSFRWRDSQETSCFFINTGLAQTRKPFVLVLFNLLKVSPFASSFPTLELIWDLILDEMHHFTLIPKGSSANKFGFGLSRNRKP